MSYKSNIEGHKDLTGSDLSGQHFEGLESRLLMAGQVGTEQSALAYDAKGNLHMAYYDATAHNLKYSVQLAGSDTWSAPVTVDASSKDVGQQASLAIDKNGLPGVAYRDAVKQDLKYAHFDGKKWVVSTVDAKNNTGVNPSLAFDKTGKALISYFRPTANDLLLATQNGKTWSLATIAKGALAGQFSSVAVNPATGLPAVAFEGTDGKIRYAEKTGKVMGKPVFIDTVPKGKGNEISLTFAGGNKPALGYYNPATGQVKIATKTGKSFVSQRVATVPTGSDPGATVVLDATGKPEVVFYDSASDGVYVAKGSGELKQLSSGGGPGSTVVAPGGNLTFVAQGDDGKPEVHDTRRIPVGPTALIATPGEDSVELSWTDNSTNEAGFIIERSDDNGASYATLDTTDADETGYVDDSAVEGAAYIYRVTAVGIDGDKSVTSVTAGVNIAPISPDSVTANPISTTSVTVTWVDRSAVEAGFQIQRSTDGGANWANVGSAAINAGTFIDNTASEGTTYTYRVQAVSGDLASDWSESEAVTTVPASPTSAAGVSVSATRVNVTWVDVSANETSYVIERKTGNTWSVVGTAAANAQTFPDTSVTAGVTYAYRVKAVGTGGSSGYSTTGNVVVIPAAPVIEASGVGVTRVDMAWAAVSGATSYVVERSSDGGETYGDGVTVETNSYSDTTAAESSVYQYRVRAVNAGGASVNSNVATATTFLAAPSDLSVSSSAPGHLTLTWTDNATSETGYVVERSVNEGDYAVVATDVAANATGYTDTVADGVTYSYRVHAVKDARVSDVSFVASGASALATPTNLTPTAISLTRVDLTWSDNSAGESGYEVWRSTNGGEYSRITTTAADATGYSDTGASEGKTYTYQVRATNTLGFSAYATSANVTVKPAAPSGLTATPSGTSTINLSWTDNSTGETGYRVEKSTDGGNTYPTQITLGAGVTTYSDTAGTEGFTYKYRVIATNAGGDSVASNVATATTVAAAPTNLVATVTSATSVHLTWSDNSSHESGYLVQRSSDNGATFTDVLLLSANTGSYDDNGVSAGTSYVYRVQTINSVDVAANSNTQSVLTLPGVASALTPSATGATTVTVTWTAAAGATSYLVERSGDAGSNWNSLGSVGTASINDVTATEGGTFIYRVTSHNATGNGVTSSNSTSVTTVPAAPTGLTATVIAAGEVDLHWTDASGHETGYVVERSADNGANWSAFQPIATNSTTFPDTTTAGGVIYLYRLHATGAAGVSLDSNTFTALTIPAAIGTLTATTAGTGGANLSWSDIAGETGYTIDRSTNGGTDWTYVTDLPANSIAYTDSGLTEGTTYTYRVRGVNTSGTAADSNLPSTTTKPAAASGLVATPINATRVDLNWTDNSLHETSFVIERSNDNGANWGPVHTADTNDTSWSDTGVVGGTTYLYRMHAVAAGGNSTDTDNASALTVPVAVTTINVTDTNATTAHLTWSDGAGETAYVVNRSADGGANWTHVIDLDANTVSYDDTAITEGATFSYSITATNATGSSAAGNTPSVITIPAAASTLSPTPVNATRVDLSWVDVSNHETGYRVERSSDNGVTWPTSWSLAAGSTSYSDTSASPATTYKYRVFAVGVAGDSAASNIVSALTVPDVVGAASALAAANTHATVSWSSVSGATGYTVERSSDNGVNWTFSVAAGNVLSYADSSAVEGTAYLYRVSATNATGAGVASDTAAVTTLPAAATGFTATPITATRVDLAWLDNSGGETGYLIERSVDGGSHYDPVWVTLANATTYSDTGAAEGTAYTYRVKPVDLTGTGTGITATATTIPATPTALTPTPINATRIDLTWADNSAHETGYLVQRSTDNATWGTIKTFNTPNATSFSDTDVTGGNSYYYRVIAVGAGGNSVAATAGPVLTVPSTVTDLTLSVISATQINVTWSDAAGETGYTLERSSNGGGSWVTANSPAMNATSYNDTGVSEGVTYIYRLTSANNTGPSAASNLPTATTLPAAVTGVTLTPVNATRVDLTWTQHSAHENGFYIERSLNGTDWDYVATADADAISYSDTGVAAGTGYTYRVRATQGSAFSADSNLPTTLTIPAAPTSLHATVTSDTNVDITWDAMTGADTYLVEYSTDSGSTWHTVSTSSTNSTSHSTATEATSYLYQVTAINATGSSVTTTLGSAVKTLAAAVTGVAVTPINAGRIDIVWVDNSGGESSFRVERSTNNVDWTSHTAAANDTSWSDTSVSGGTTYYYRVFAVDVTGDSALSNVDHALTVPDQVTTLTATPATSTQINLSWEASTGAAHYLIESSDDNGGSWNTVATVGAVTSYPDVSVAEATAYLYQITPINATGSGVVSDTQAATTYPTAATGLSATPISATRVDLAWTDVSNGETSYIIQRSDDNGENWPTVHTSAAGAISWSDTTVTGGNSYRYRVLAHNTTGDADASNVSTVLTVPAAAANFTPHVVATGEIDLTWDLSNGATSYSIESSSDSGVHWNPVITINDATANSYHNTLLTEGTTYQYHLIATDATGDSANSSTSAKTIAAAATGLTATPISDSEVDLVWVDNSNGETGFRIERSIDGGDWATAHTTVANVTGWNDTGLSGGTSYQYRVYAYDVTADSDVAGPQTALTLPSQVTGVQGTAISQSQIDVTWTAATGADTYDVYRSSNAGANYTYAGTVSGLIYHDTGRAEAHDYIYEVYATDATGTGVVSADANATTLPAAPTGLTAIGATTTHINLSWSDNSGAETGYKIERSDNNGETFTEIHLSAANATSYLDTTATEGHSYIYQVRAYNTPGNSDYSGAANGNSAPAAPTGTGASPVDATHVTVTWTDHSNGEDGFQIERSDNGGSTWTQIGTVATDVQTYSDDAAPEGTAVQYQVRAYKGTVESTYDTVASAATISATPTDLSASAISATRVDLTWTNNAANDTGYDIYRSTNDGVSWTNIHSSAANATSYSDTGAPEDMALKYKVVATGAPGGDSADSNIASATTPIAPATVLTATAQSDTTIALVWTDNSTVQTAYKIERTTNGVDWTLVHTTDANATSWSDTDRAEDTTYTYRVTATDGVVDSTASNTSAAKTALTAPSTAHASSVTATSISVTWTDNSNAESLYRVERSDDSGGTWTEIGTVGAGVTSYSDTVAEGTSHLYQVRATNTGNTSAYSSSASVIAIPATPGSVTATPFSTTRIDVAWSDNSAHETGYIIERSTNGGISWTDIHTAAINDTAWSDTGAHEASDYQYRVRATGAGADSAESDPSSTATTAPNAPTTLTSTVISANEIDLTWADNSNGETAYEIQRSTNNGVSFTPLTTVDPGTTSYPDTTAAEATAYVYQVRAVRNSAQSTWSNATTQVTTLPAAPTNLTTATPTNTRVVLTWSDNSLGETGYKIQRSLNNGVSWTTINTTIANTTTYSDNTVTEGGSYQYRVIAYNTTGDSDASNVASALTAPSSPTGLTGSAASPTQINLTWIDHSSNEAGFYVERSSDGGTHWGQVADLPANTTSWPDTLVSEATNYQYRVRAYGAGSTTSGYTNSVSVTPPLLAPSNLSATTVSATRVDLTWTDNSGAEAQYKVERSSNAGSSWTVIATLTANSTSYSDTTASEGTAYLYQVRATRTGNASAYSASSAATTLPAAPTSLTSTVASDTQINLSWTDNSTGESGFIVERSTNGTDWEQVGSQLAANTISYNDTTATEGTGYTYRVKAVNAGGPSGYATATRVTSLPAAPTTLVATSSAFDTVNLTWVDNSAHETGFKIERSDDGGNTWTQIDTAPANATSCTDPTCNEGTLYKYRVRANLGSSNSAYSNVYTVTTVPLGPTTLTATPISQTRVDLVWDDNSGGETSYRIERSDDGGLTFVEIHSVAAGTTTYSDTTASEGIPYQYRIRAANVGGFSGYSPSAEAQTLPAAPSDLATNVISANEVDLVWTDNSVGEDGFILERDTDSAGTWDDINVILGPDSNSYADTTTDTGHTYTYRIRAFNASGESANSGTASATTP